MHREGFDAGAETGLQARQVEQVVGEPRQSLSVTEQDVDEGAARLGIGGGDAGQGFGGGDDGRHRRAQLMRGVGHQVAPQPLQPPCLGHVEQHHHHLLRGGIAERSRLQVHGARADERFALHLVAARERGLDGFSQLGHARCLERPAPFDLPGADEGAEGRVGDRDAATLDQRYTFGQAVQDGAQLFALGAQLGDVRRQLCPQGAEGAHQLAQLVVARRGQVHVEVAAAHRPGGGGHRQDRPAQPTRKGGAEEKRQRQRRQRRHPPGTVGARHGLIYLIERERQAQHQAARCSHRNREVEQVAVIGDGTTDRPARAAGERRCDLGAGGVILELRQLLGRDLAVGQYSAARRNHRHPRPGGAAELLGPAPIVGRRRALELGGERQRLALQGRAHQLAHVGHQRAIEQHRRRSRHPRDQQQQHRQEPLLDLRTHPMRGYYTSCWYWPTENDSDSDLPTETPRRLTAFAPFDLWLSDL